MSQQYNSVVVAKTLWLAKTKVFTVRFFIQKVGWSPKIRLRLAQLYKRRKVNYGEPDNEESSDSTPNNICYIYTKVCLRHSLYLSHRQHRGQHK